MSQDTEPTQVIAIDLYALARNPGVAAMVLAAYQQGKIVGAHVGSGEEREALPAGEKLARIGEWLIEKMIGDDVPYDVALTAATIDAWVSNIDVDAEAERLVDEAGGDISAALIKAMTDLLKKFGSEECPCPKCAANRASAPTN